ncbi:MAG: class I SAM-dependent methyltransferase, partial [Acutalibacteraceae bacterium]|nr:class I SAM-dependent methyltransferase [Acutalibacteraceae bacterium]
LLDLACGTGGFSNEMSAQGISVIGVDISPEMLSVARESSAEQGQDILYLCQDASELDLYGTVDGAICCLDSLNHITDYEKFKAAIARVSLFLEPGRLFIFDMNTAYKHECVLGNRTIVKETDEVFCVWQNEYNRENRTTEISLDFFQEEEGAYYRSSEQFCERAYTEDEIAAAIESAGLEVVAVFEEMTDTAPTDTTERAVYITRKR